MDASRRAHKKAYQQHDDWHDETTVLKNGHDILRQCTQAKAKRKNADLHARAHGRYLLHHLPDNTHMLDACELQPCLDHQDFKDQPLNELGQNRIHMYRVLEKVDQFSKVAKVSRHVIQPIYWKS
jgi:hypothetical protein